MARAFTVSLAIVLVTGIMMLVQDARAAQQPPSASADSQPSPHYDAEAERRLLEMANQDRAKAGLPPLKRDDGLTQAARAHATAMAAQRKLSHQLAGEPNLEQRLAANSKDHLDQSGENVAYAGTVDEAEDSLMHSPPHRANLLNADYNVAGFSVVRSGSLLYVTQDFGHSLPTRSDDEADVLVGRSVDRMRAQSHLPPLQRLDNKEATATACAMADADSLQVPTPRSREIIRYTTAQPQDIPQSVAPAIGSRSVRAFAAGSCYARTAKYPTGVYWIAVLFY
jgi:uncharacterized protein YkwD